jgi:hypothetical protein
MDVLSELINEIQASNDLKLDIQPQPKLNLVLPCSPMSKYSPISSEMFPFPSKHLLYSHSSSP